MNNLKKLLCILAFSLSPLTKEIENEIREIEKREAGRIEYSEIIKEDVASVVSHNYFAKPKSDLVIQINSGYETIFQGEKIRFKVNDKKIFDKFSLRQKAKVKYQETYVLTYKDINKDGEDELIETKSISSKFLDAKPLN